MSENFVLTVLVENASSMNALGAIAGEHLLDPRLYPQENLIVCAYGVQNSGKSYFFKASKNAILDKDEPNAHPTGGIQFISEDFASGSFSKSTYPNQMGHKDISGDQTMLDIIKKTNNEPIVHLFEHSPVNILAESNIGIIISWSAQPKEDLGGKSFLNDFYLTAMADNLARSARKKNLKDGAVAKVIDQLREARKDVCDGPRKRIVRLFPLSDAPEIQTALERTREEIMNTPDLSIIAVPPPSGHLARIKKRPVLNGALFYSIQNRLGSKPT